MSIPYSVNRIGGVMVSMLASCAVDRWCEPKKNQRLWNWNLLILL